MLATGLLTAGCPTFNGECTTVGLAVLLPQGRAQDIQGISLAGEACRNGQVFCATSADSSCADFTVGLVDRFGPCTVTVSFKSGAPSFTAQVAYVKKEGYCGPTPEPQAIYVPELEGGRP